MSYEERMKEATFKELKKTNALLETIGAILLHQCEVNEKGGMPAPLYSILELRKSLVAASQQ